MKPKRSPKWWFYFITPLLSTVLALLVAELALHFLYPVPFSIENNMYFETDPFTGYRLKPNSTGSFQNDIVAKANSNGHRDNFIPVEKQTHVFRILVIGDSFTVGANVEQEQAYAQVLETLLVENNTTKIEVVNAGIGGWEPFQYAQYYENYGRHFSPDLVLIGFFIGNDTFNSMKTIAQTPTTILGRRIGRRAEVEQFIYLKIFLYQYSHIARLVLNEGPVRSDFTRQHCQDFTDQNLKIQRIKLPNHLKRDTDREHKVSNAIGQISRIKALTNQDAIPLVVILIPDENQINEKLQQQLLTKGDLAKYDFDMPQSMLVALFADAQIPTIDLLAEFRNDTRCLYMNDTHWTNEGHTLAAQTIYRHLIQMGLFQ